MPGLKTRMALGSCHCDGRTKWHMLMYLVAWIDRKVAMATKATVMEEICQSDILYVLGGAAGRMLDHKVAMATKDTDRGGLLVDAVVIVEHIFTVAIIAPMSEVPLDGDDLPHILMRGQEDIYTDKIIGNY